MNTIDEHGSIGPLHTFHNTRLLKILSSAATFNNNISLVLVMTFERMHSSNGRYSMTPDYSQSSAMTNFLKVAVLSIVLGALVGGCVTYLLRHKEFLSVSPVLETLYVMVGAYLAYALAHLPVFQLSGDVAIFFYGVMMSHYNKFNMNVETFRNIG
jgi:NhaP-type Na+/H+ or K+/H+ antiporter